MYQEKFHDDMERNTYKQLHLLELATAARVKPRRDGGVAVNPAPAPPDDDEDFEEEGGDSPSL